MPDERAAGRGSSRRKRGRQASRSIRGRSSRCAPPPKGLRNEVGPRVRGPRSSPAMFESDLKFGTTGTAQSVVLDFYKVAIPANSVAQAIAFAIEQPADVDIMKSSFVPRHRSSDRFCGHARRAASASRISRRRASTAIGCRVRGNDAFYPAAPTQHRGPPGRTQQGDPKMEYRLGGGR